MFDDILSEIDRFIMSGELVEASAYLLERASILCEKYPGEADQLAVFSERLININRENQKILLSVKGNRVREDELVQTFNSYKKKLEIPFDYIFAMESLGEPVLYRGGISRHPLGPDHFFEIKKFSQLEDCDDYILHDEFLDKLKAQVEYYDYMAPYNNRNFLSIGRRKAVVGQGKYHAYLALKKQRSSIEKSIFDLRKQAKSIVEKLEKFHESKELAVQYFWVESELGGELKLLEERLTMR